MIAEDRPTIRAAVHYDGALLQCGGRRLEATSGTRSGDLYVVLYEAPPYDLELAELDVPRLSINLVDAPVSGGIATDRTRSYAGRRHSLFFTPAGADAHWAKSLGSRHLNIYLHDGVLDDLDGKVSVLSPDQPLLDVHSRRVKPWIDALDLAIQEEGSFAEDAALGLAYLIVAELARTPRRPGSHLAPSVIHRLRQYVRANLTQPIRVADLAALARMPVGRFVGAFRASTGCTPHRYVLRARAEAAQRLLTKTRYPLAAVAADCGFASQQHMATVLRKMLAMTPLQIRTEACRCEVADPCATATDP